MNWKFLFSIVFCLLLSACGPGIRRGVDHSGARLRMLALLPTNYPSDIRRERIEYLHGSLRRELEGNGYILLDEAAVENICISYPCKNPNLLASKYGLDGLVTLDVSSTYRANFGAGFVNTVSGTVRLLTPASLEILSVEHTETERGGLLFNSGQVLQGLLSTNENLGDNRFNLLADRFISAVAAELPKASGTIPQIPNPVIQEVSTRPEGNGRYQICASGTPGNVAFFSIDRIKVPLREMRSGVYCNSLLLGGLVKSTSSVFAELRSAFGANDRKKLDGNQFLICDVSTLIQRGPSATLTYGCPSDSGGLSDCESKLSSCKDAELVVYRAGSSGGPFEKAGLVPIGVGSTGNIPDRRWSDKSGNSNAYAVVAVSPNGSTSALLPPADSK